MTMRTTTKIIFKLIYFSTEERSNAVTLVWQTLHKQHPQ